MTPIEADDCSESDALRNHKIFTDFAPIREELIKYPTTAGERPGGGPVPPMGDV